MNILVITDVLWRDDNGVGNSYSAIFKNMPGVKIANICCQEGISENEVSSACFQISEGRLIRNLKDNSIKTGICERKAEQSARSSGSGFDKLKRLRLTIFFWARNLIWKVGRWQSQELNTFIDDFNPDLIFAQLQDKMYQNNIVKYVQKYSGKPLVVYAWDDVYSLKQFKLSPLFWIDRLFQRASIRSLMKRCSILYTISDEQKEEYKKSLNIRTELLYKGYSFENKPENAGLSEPIRILYTGNLYSNRYKTIKSLCKSVHKLNKDKTVAQVDIYSATPLTKREIDEINIAGTSCFGGKISEKQVQELQKRADVLLHVEPFTLSGSLACRLSFSTKLVDYFKQNKCIFAVGSRRCSSMKYLKRNDAAIVANNFTEMEDNLKTIINDKNIINVYSDKAWECGVKNHQIKDIQNRLLRDFEEVINESSAN